MSDLFARSALIVLLSVPAVNAVEPETAAEKLIQLNRTLVIAHRGYRTAAPENTLPAFKLAKGAGADLVELDYHHSRDHVPVVVHDAELDRTTDALARWGGRNIRVDSKTAEELHQLDAGHWFGSNYCGTRLPSLADALSEIQGGGMTLIERKAGDAATCVRLLQERQWVNQVVVQSFDWSYLREFHRLEPRQVLAALGPLGTRSGRQLKDEEKTLGPVWVDEVLDTGARVIVWNSQITRQAVDYAHRKGLKVWVYTINDAAIANQLLDQGIDGIITDNPALLWKALALRNATPLHPRAP